jgi:signal transduction histidine kinase
VVADDGAGFDVAATLAQIRPGHLGLVAMRERAELAEGWLRIDSGGEGTAVAFWLPNKPDPRSDKPEPPLDEVARR